MLPKTQFRLRQCIGFVLLLSMAWPVPLWAKATDGEGTYFTLKDNKPALENQLAQNTVDEQATVQQVLNAAGEGEKKYRFSITPRVWYSNFNTNNFSNNQNVQGSEENISMLQYGFTVTVGMKSKPQWDALFTYLHGHANGNAALVFRNGIFGLGDFDAYRDDAELLLRYRLKESNVYFVGGFRYISFVWDLTHTQTNSPVPIFTGITNSNRWREEFDIFLFEAGMGHYNNITSDGRHRIFSNVVMGLGWFEWQLANAIPNLPDSEVTDDAFSLDVNVGYAWNFHRNANINIRYRGFATNIEGRLSGGSERGDPNIIHGPEIGFTYRF